MSAAPTPLADASPPAAPSPSPPRPVLPPPMTKRQPSFWERTKQQTVGVWDNAYKLGSRGNKQLALEGFLPSSLEVESIRAAKILRTFTWDAADLPEESLADRRKSQIVLRKIPPETIQSAKGLAIFTVFRTGSLFGAVGGSGVVISRLPDGSWSSPSGILLKNIGFAFCSGVDIYDVVLLLRTDSAVESFCQPSVSLGESLPVAAGPVGSVMLLDDEAESAAIWSYTKSRALYERIQLAGTVLVERVDENARSYGRTISAEEILNGAVRPSDWFGKLNETILAAQGSDFRAELIPQGPSPSEIFPSPPLDEPAQDPFSPPISPPVSPDPSIMSNLSRSSNRRLPKEELSEEDLAAKRELEEAMRSFGIEDPTVNERSRSEDPLLVVEEGRDESFEFPARGGGDETPGLTRSTGSRASSTSACRSARSSVDLSKNANGQDSSKSSSLTNSPNTPSKPPVPPRRTPRIPAPASPVVANDEEKIENKEDNIAGNEEQKTNEDDKRDEGEVSKTEEVIEDGANEQGDAQEGQSPEKASVTTEDKRED